MASAVFNIAKKGFLDGTEDLDTNTYKILLLDNSGGYTFDADDADLSVAGITAGELSGTGYVGGFAGAGRKTLSITVSQDDTDDEGVADDSSDYTWTGLDAGTVQAAVVVREVTTDADSIPICYLDGADFPKVTNGSDFIVQFNAEGIINIT